MNVNLWKNSWRSLGFGRWFNENLEFGNCSEKKERDGIREKMHLNNLLILSLFISLSLSIYIYIYIAHTELNYLVHSMTQWYYFAQATKRTKKMLICCAWFQCHESHPFRSNEWPALYPSMFKNSCRSLFSHVSTVVWQWDLWLY